MTKDEVGLGELVERLREPVDWAHFVTDDHASDYQAERHEAADALTSLQAENASLIRDNASYVEANAELLRERDALADELHDVQQPMWPKWALDITAQLQSYGVEVDPFEGWDLPVDLDDWLSEAVRIETEKLSARAEASEAQLKAARETLARIAAIKYGKPDTLYAQKTVIDYAREQAASTLNPTVKDNG